MKVICSGSGLSNSSPNVTISAVIGKFGKAEKLSITIIKLE